MEYYPKMKELGAQYWKFRRSRQDELRWVEFCKGLLKLHLQALLQRSRADIVELLSDPAEKLWKDEHVEKQLKQRLADSYSAYVGILAIVKKRMAQTMKAANVDDEGFKQYLASMVVAIQPKIGKLAWEHRERAESFGKLEASIEQLKDLLEAVDSVSETNKTQSLVKNYRIPTAMQGFWHRAERVWYLIYEHLRCVCRSKHCASLWFDSSSMTQDSLGLVFLFDKAVPQTAEPWKRYRLNIHRSNKQCTCGQHAAISQPLSNATSATLSIITVQAVDPTGNATSIHELGPTTTTSPISQYSTISVKGLCELLKHHEKEHVCLGALCAQNDDHPYHFIPNSDDGLYDFVSLSAVLDPTFRPGFELRPLMKLAAMIASAHMRFYRTAWIPGRWTLGDVCFPKDTQDSTKVKSDMPYILANFVDPSSKKKQQKLAMDHGFITLAIMFLELCFGRPLETHDIWSAETSLNSADPFHRQYVAVEWAKTIDLMIDGSEYARVVKWCMSESPSDDKDDLWRDDFAMNVLGPLLKCANMLS